MGLAGKLRRNMKIGLVLLAFAFLAGVFYIGVGVFSIYNPYAFCFGVFLCGIASLVVMIIWEEQNEIS